MNTRSCEAGNGDVHIVHHTHRGQVEVGEDPLHFGEHLIVVEVDPHADILVGIAGGKGGGVGHIDLRASLNGGEIAISTGTAAASQVLDARKGEVGEPVTPGAIGSGDAVIIYRFTPKYGV